MITASSDKKLFLIDAYALIFRAYYAFIKNPRINSKGMNTSAVFGFTNAILEIIRNEHPTHLAVVFDAPGGSFRAMFSIPSTRPTGMKLLKISNDPFHGYFKSWTGSTFRKSARLGMRQMMSLVLSPKKQKSKGSMCT